ncbi:hypothetical protein [Streptomyces gardneri]|uniref:Uncharacterized protein n=1 Tax=Streptomyces gardneri TaxID=66892 RepID=A0A4Y3RDP3_9ACTN|nr:hypothetical protein [Streptomyces gardneri]ALO12669.1 Putative integral membrane protein [Streptomyces venezuelae]QPK49396.1 hypothetical protein H4W23_35545 [Streptomyces gardneri]WRK40929.1 hypothetical protein U0M97_35765 [Streptomyces venezuelae]CUM36691.1 hypothetical protein BN2537_2347 [Streptomyces venezuelae]GEB55584.1 hypothetical protein SGA01_11890 [Streptomyces gardneri]
MPEPHPPRRPRRETVTYASAHGDPAHGVVPGPARRPLAHAPARSEIDEQTTLGHTYVRSLMRSQLRAALTALAALALLVGSLPLLLALPAPEALVWIALGAGVYPVVWAIAHWYVRRAERNERDFTGLVER